MSGIPGPSSLATTRISATSPVFCVEMVTRPSRAWVRMLRATSEIAVAMSVASVLEKPSSRARRLPSARATTMSRSEAMGTRTSSSIAFPLSPPPEECQPFLQIERGVHPFQGQPQLNQGESHLRLDSDNHRFRPLQLGHQGHGAEGTRYERVHDVEGGNVENHPLRPVASHVLGEVVLELN